MSQRSSNAFVYFVACDFSKINQNDGVQYIVDALKQPPLTRSIYLKRKYLHEYEYVQRSNGETIRSFCNRYSCIERSLHSVGFPVESRGARLLDRFRLNLDQQRLILVASGQSLEFDVIREAAQIQFPDHRRTPPAVYSKEFEGRQDRQLASNILAIMVAKVVGNLRTPALVASKQSAVTLRDTLFSRQTTRIQCSR